jgi:pilus assembly protein CpaE
MDRVVFERSLTRHRSGVHLLAPPLTLAEIARVTPKGVRQALSIARTLYPFVVVDLDDCFHEEQAQALRMADLVLLVLRLDFTSLRNMRRTMDHLDQLGIHRERVRLIVNRYGQAKELPSAKAEEVLGLKIFHYIPEDAKTVNLANNNGIPAVLDSPKASVSRSFAKLTTGVQSLVGAL